MFYFQVVTKNIMMMMINNKVCQVPQQLHNLLLYGVCFYLILFLMLWTGCLYHFVQMIAEPEKAAAAAIDAEHTAIGLFIYTLEFLYNN